MAYVHQIRQIDFENSFQEPGYRTKSQSQIPVGAVVAVFFNFCSFHCVDCWNSETWERKEDLYVDDEIVANEIIKAVTARDMTPPMGLSLLGGDPILPENITATRNILELVLSKLPDLVIGVWSGYTWKGIERALSKNTKEADDLDWVLNHIDVLVDGPFNRLKKTKNRRYGSLNQRVINVPQTLATGTLTLTESYLAEHAEDVKREKTRKQAHNLTPSKDLKLPKHLTQ